MSHEDRWQPLDELYADDRPSSLEECIDDNGRVDYMKYVQFMEKDDDLDELEMEILASVDDERLAVEEEPKKRKKSKPRQCKSLRPYYFDDTGKVFYLVPWQTV